MSYYTYSWVGDEWNDDDYEWRFHGRPARDLEPVLAPLVRELHKYDMLRLALAHKGAKLDTFREMTRILSTPIQLDDGSDTLKINLSEPQTIQTTLSRLDPDLHFEVRRSAELLPTYYLCRARWDYWLEFGLVVEDLYASPGYLPQDDRVVRLMRSGHEVYYLHLSQFREKTVQMLSEGSCTPVTGQSVDRLLYRLGRYVFQAMWHEDQRPALAACIVLGLERFRQALELLYLCLSGDLCELRSVTDEYSYRFLTDLYPQPVVCLFLKTIETADGTTLASFPQAALPLFKRLSKSFVTFLKKQVPWGNSHLDLPLYKVIFGNYNHLGTVKKALVADDQVQTAVQVLEAVADGVIGEILDVPAGKIP